MGEILEAVRETGSNTEVYMDGGIRSGSDVFKALAVGAKAVFVGRPALWGLAANVSSISSSQPTYNLLVNHLRLIKDYFRGVSLLKCDRVT